jgi:hypothetical protein
LPEIGRTEWTEWTGNETDQGLGFFAPFVGVGMKVTE